MKPKDLKFPYRWEERRPELVDKVLFVPDYYDRHREWTFPGWSAIFGNDRPVVIEFCTGNGTWIAEKAKDSPYNWVAVEWRFDRVRKIWSKMKNYGLSNLMVVCGEAQTFAREYIPSKSVAQAYINFPDPWPKEKHAKNRLFQAPFVDELARIVSETVIVATDDPVYADQITHEMLKQWNSAFPEPYYVNDWPDYGTSFFDALWRGKGKTIRYFQFEAK
jgi:tRNA (guanine-N7-)-methyltransferase